MVLYFTIFFIIAVFSFMELYGLNRRDVLKLYILICLGFFIMSFIRWCGGDWFNYHYYFRSIPTVIHESVLEYGYSFINGIAKVYTNNFSVALFLCGIILFGFQSPAIWKLSPYPLLSLLFLFGISYGSIFFVRQTIAVGILLYAVVYIRDRRFLPFLMCIILASSFHRSSWIFILAWWAYGWKIHTYLMVILLLGSIAFSGVIKYILQSLGPLVGGLIQIKIENYTTDSGYGTLPQPFYIIMIKALFSKLLLVILSIVMLARICKNSPEFRGYFNIYGLGTILYFSTISISPALARFAHSFELLQIILLPYIIREIKGKELRLFAIIVSFMYIALRLYTVTSGEIHDEIIPFKTIFDQ